MTPSTAARGPRLALGVYLLLVRTCVQGSMLTELKVCVQPGMHTLVSLVCPPDFLVIIAEAAYRRSQVPGCHPSLEDACLASDVSSQLTMPCFFRLGTCKIKLLASNMPQCQVAGVPYGGQPYFHVLYKCEPLMLSSNPLQRTVDMCSGAEVDGSLVYLWNTNFPQYTTQRTCRCVAHTGLTNQVQVTLPHFKAHRQPANSRCQQVIHFWSGSEVRSVCSEVDDSFTPLQLDVNRSLYIEFDNPRRDLTQFWITIGVHLSQTMSVRCGEGLVFPPRPMGLPQLLPTLTTPTLTTPTMATPTSAARPAPPTERALQSAQHANSIGYIPILAAVLGATLVLVIIIMVVVFGCKHKRKRPQPGPAVISEVADYAFDNDTYLTDAARRRHHQSTHARASAVPATPSSVLDGKHVVVVTEVGGEERAGGGGGGGSEPKRFLSLEAPKGTVVPNPYAGLPADSPHHAPQPATPQCHAPPTASPAKRSVVSAEYEDLAHFHQVFRAMLRQRDSESSGVAETRLHEP